MRLSEWLTDARRSFGDRLAVVDGLLRGLKDFHENEPGTRPALDPGSIDVGSDFSASLKNAPRALDPHTAAYRAPETNEGAPYGPSADTFSMGVLCYEVLSGRHPFLMETPQGTLEPMTNVPATPLRDVAPEVPRDLADAIMACLERDPEWRAKDLSYLAEVAVRSKPAGKGKTSVPKRAAGPEPRSTSSSRPSPSFMPNSRPAPSKSSRLPLLLGSAAGMLALVGGLFWFTRPAPPPRESPRPTPSAPVATPSEQPTAGPSTPTPVPTPVGVKTPSAAPSVIAPSPTPTPSSVATPTPVAVPTSTPRPTPTPVSVPSVAPTAAPATPTPGPTAPPTTQAPVLSGPASVATIVPAKLRRPSTTMVDVRGTALRPDHRAQVLKGREIAPGVSVAGQKYVDPTWVKVLIKIDADAPTGTYQVLLVDGNGQGTNAKPLEVSK